MVCAVRSGRLSRSEAESTTCSSFPISYPRTTSSQGISRFSVGHQRRLRSRLPSFLQRRWRGTDDPSSVATWSRTGIATMPKLMDPLHTARGMSR